MKKVILCLSFISFLSACAGSSGGSSNQEASLGSQSKIQGVWQGHVSGNSDTMTIDSSCKVTSSYCASQSTVTFYEVKTGSACTGGVDTCGSARIYVNSSPSNPGCSAPTTHMDCTFDTTSTTLHYYCSGNTTTYTK